MEKLQGGTRVTVNLYYNGDGLRTQKTVTSSEEGYATQVTNFTYDRQHVILVTDENDELQTRYVRGICLKVP